MASQAAGTSAQDKIVSVLSRKLFDGETNRLLPPAYTREALAEVTGLSLPELRAALGNLMELGQVIIRVQKYSGEVLYKLKGPHHDAWQSQNTKL